MSILTVFIGLFTLTLVHSATPASNELVDTLLPNVFRLIDLDENGNIESSELKAALHSADYNDDDIITEREFFVAAVSTVPTMWTCAKTLYKKLDVMHYNLIRVSKENLVYDLMDTNGNGNLDETEFVNFIADAASKCSNTDHINQRRRKFVPPHLE